jgi:hypothetical protein
MPPRATEKPQQKAAVEGGPSKPKPKRRRLKTKQTSFLDPERLYTRAGFMEAAGISLTRLSDARHEHGLSPEFFLVGAKQFIHGKDAIEYIVRLAAALSK